MKGSLEGFLGQNILYMTVHGHCLVAELILSYCFLVPSPSRQQDAGPSFILLKSVGVVSEFPDQLKKSWRHGKFFSLYPNKNWFSLHILLFMHTSGPSVHCWACAMNKNFCLEYRYGGFPIYAICWQQVAGYQRNMIVYM